MSSLGDKTTSNRAVKSPPAQDHRKHTLTLSNCNNSVHTAVQTILVPSSNSFGQNKIGHEFCLPKTDSSNFTLSMKNQPTLFKTCNLYSRHRKVSIRASLVSNNIKLGFHVVVPQLQHPNSQARRLLGGHGCKNHDIPNSQLSKTCKCSDQTDHHGLSTLMLQIYEITKVHRCHRITRSQNCIYSNLTVGTTMTLSNNNSDR